MKSKADKMPNWLRFYFPKICHLEDRTDQPPTEPKMKYHANQKRGCTWRAWVHPSTDLHPSGISNNYKGMKTPEGPVLCALRMYVEGQIEALQV